MDRRHLCQSEDVPEKSHQVTMMDSIFQGAIGVRMCIGPHSDNSELLFKRIAEHVRILGNVNVSDQVFATWENAAERDFPESWSTLDMLGILDCFYSLRKEIELLIHAPCQFPGRSYFTRLWIVRGVSLAREAWVLCGQSTVRLFDFHTFGCNIVTFSKFGPVQSSEDLSDARSLTLHPAATLVECGIRKSKFEPVSLSHSFGSLCCTYFRDRVLALLHVV